jgi:esterase/lipase
MIAKSFYPQFSKNQPHKLQKEDIQELISAIKNYNSKSGFLNDINQNIVDETLTKIKCSTLIIHSENDNSVSLEHPENANIMIENSKIQILKNEWGHLFWIGTDSKKSIEMTVKFIEK